MFDKIKFAQLLKKISETYENQRDFSKKSEINRTYLSQYMNMKLDKPPKPIILEKLANASHGLTTYEELMTVCGHIKENDLDSYLLGMLGLTEQDIIDFDNSLKKIGLTNNEKTIYNNIIEEIQNSVVQNSTSHKLDIVKHIEYEEFETQKKIMNALKLYLKYLNKMSNFASIASSINNTEYEKIEKDTPNHLLKVSEKSLDYSTTKFYMCPVYGQISAGIPNWAEECIEGRLPIDPNMMNIVDPEECFFLRVNGESMNKLVANGAYALIRKTDWVENGEIAVVLVNGFDATLKKFSKQGDLVVLEPMSNDNSFQVQIYDKNTPIKVLGKYIGKFEMK